MGDHGMRESLSSQIGAARPEQDGKPGVVQPITTEPSVGSEGGVGVVIHLSKTREKRINISSIE
jgi:hypothetical protein